MRHFLEFPFWVRSAGWTPGASPPVAPPRPAPPLARWSDRLALLGRHVDDGAWAAAAEVVIDGLLSETAPHDIDQDTDRYFAMRYALCLPLEAAQREPLVAAVRAQALRDGGFSDRLEDQVVLAMADEAEAHFAAAAHRVGVLTEQHPRNTEARTVLARLISADAAASSPPILGGRPDAGRKVFDAFPFFNEFMMLDIKLAEMSPWVDAFVLVESTRTFTGEPKRLYFQDAKDRYAEYRDKIVHVVVDDVPAHVETTWAREFHQRDMALRGLPGLCAPDDLIIVSDVDEIVRRDAIETFDGQGARLALDTYKYFFNLQFEVDRDIRTQTSVWRAEWVQKFGLSGLRLATAYSATLPPVADAGWHFTSVASADQIARKLRSYSHKEHAHKGEGKFRRQLANLRAGGDADRWRRHELDERFPASLRENAAAYAEFIL